MEVRDGLLDVGRSPLYYRLAGAGLPVVVAHGGPDLDHHYLLPELDRLADRACLIYYDQRGRGRSAAAVSPDYFDIPSEIEDLDLIRRHFGDETVALLGHSWGGLLAAEYTLRHPEHVSHLILMNTAPLSHDGFSRMRTHWAKSRSTEDTEVMALLRASGEFQQGDVATDVEYVRRHWTMAFEDVELLERVVGRVRAHFTPDTILLAREIEGRLAAQTGGSPDYDLAPGLRQLDVPVLVMHGERDFIPVDIAEEIADSVPTAELRILKGLGHFAFAEDPGLVAEVVWDFLGIS